MTTIEEYKAKVGDMKTEEQKKFYKEFWGSLSEVTIERICKWAAQLKVPLSELRDRFNNKMASLQIQLKDQIPDDRIEGVARSQFANEVRPGRSRAETYEGIVLGYGPLRDWNEFWFNVAKGANDKDVLQARMDGIVNDDGLALVTQEIKDRKGQYFRKNVGDLLEHEWQRSLLAIGRPVVRKEGEDTMRIFHISLGGDPARFADAEKFPRPEPGKICRWRCNVQEVNTEWNWIRANGATVTAFEADTVQTKSGPVKGVLDAKKCAGLLNQVRPNFRSEIAELKSWLDEHSKQTGHFVVIEGEIMNMYERAVRIGNADQMDLENIPSVLVNLDATIPDHMFYGENSTVIVACHPFERNARVRDESGQWVTDNDELGNPKKEIVANGIAIFPIIAMPKEQPKVPEAEAPPAEEKVEEETSTIEL